MTKIGMALGSVATLGAVLLAGVGTASAAQGSHHPTHNGAGGLVDVDNEFTVYRENINNRNRWRINNAHHTGGVRNTYSIYYVDDSIAWPVTFSATATPTARLFTSLPVSTRCGSASPTTTGTSANMFAPDARKAPSPRSHAVVDALRVQNNPVNDSPNMPAPDSLTLR
jgi:hypothetical protein